MVLTVWQPFGGHRRRAGAWSRGLSVGAALGGAVALTVFSTATAPAGASTRHRLPSTTTSTLPRTTTTTASTTTTTTATTTTTTPARGIPHVQLVPLYEYAGSPTLASDWAAACANDAVVVATGANSGPPVSTDSDWALEEEDLLPAIRSCAPHGAVIAQPIGYINTGYGSVPVSTVDAQMSQWVAFDPTIAGFFFDEANNSSSASNQAYYTAITGAARADGRTEVVWNWGADGGTTSWPFSPGQSFSTTWPNEVVVFEGTAPSFEQWVPAPWEAGSWTGGAGPAPYSNDVAALVYGTPAGSLAGLCSLVDRLWDVSNNLFEYYVTNGTAPNPYATLDSYNTTEVSEC